MEEKPGFDGQFTPPLPETEDSRRHPSPHWLRQRRRKSFVLVALVAFLTLSLVRIVFVSLDLDPPLLRFWQWSHCYRGGIRQPAGGAVFQGSEALESHKVALEAHIMSKCPDAKVCLHDLVVPAMERVSEKVNFTLSYIGTPTYQDGGVACMHGPSECLGNIIELCAANEYPDPKIHLGFTMCLTNNYQEIPERELIEDCALEHGVDVEQLDDCVARDVGAYGVGLLRDSVERSANASVTTSCTVRLNEKVRCVRDGGEWKNCEGGFEVDDLVRDIEQLYTFYD
ncbi:hypothetical protein L228DRAFT_105371 [Xylona heveae TC161]|uniref:Gamma interferon inducible lysosomal thiol reductase n=1 Tax=Xylona heveae (strain CBS 132557 / TC161) TaxID=1328760 RepID=A0A165H946_XYLHT|nr:hypothetical protein L228DRAFT_105371 [Xylona heveae TC161]KZF23159.1 hypothetical protein L228DRAFT_105371 [Xylona heveae TC161]